MGFIGVGFTVFVFAVVASRLLLQGANKHLSVEEKARLVDLSGGINPYAILFVLPLIGLYWFASAFFDFPPRALLLAYFVATLLLIVALQIANYRRLSGLEFPPQYVTKYVLSRGVYFVGIVALFSALVFGTY